MSDDVTKRLDALEEFRLLAKELFHEQKGNRIDDAQAVAALTTRIEKLEDTAKAASQKQPGSSGWWAFFGLVGTGVAGVVAYEVAHARPQRRRRAQEAAP